ncbi:PaaI family thioesterase [Sporolituus thermophilus]|uniref:Acyl-coenzyme A thioesterase PaaI, contains HGG motif n=1 Tax=Sporolituus thermophilus DSM 23256 TaxID=1123285 RepID=A0A1G7N191_9FIRM|nr:PaaI family thioesterase [Sporolituus thermophilus]SDF67784.1 Acyl-coenzyme A thioesterase PaaI, contains HGG motif [Sporolituus thermophilus DSM 23256]
MDQRNEWCFACGRLNPIGLKLTFREENNTYVTNFTAGPEHQGYDGIVHGGIVSTLLDEIMARYIYAKGMNAVTARLEVRYRQPTPVGQALTVVGWIVAKRGRIYELAGEVRLPDGTVTAEGKALVAVVDK